MKNHLFVVSLLSLFVSLAASAAAPVLSFDGPDAVVTVPAGHRVAWLYSRNSSTAFGLAADSDNDGQVRFTPPQVNANLAVVDAETGEWAVGPNVSGSVVEPPMSFGIHADTNGVFSILETGRSGPNRTLLWLRPGVGAWIAPSQWEPLAVGRDFALMDISTFVPVGDSPSTPSGVVEGDTFNRIQDRFFSTGLVDFSLASTYAGRIYFEDWTTSHIEGRTITIDVIRRLGTTGTVTTSCADSFTAVTIPPADRAQVGVDYEAFETQDITFAPGEILKQCTYTLLDDGVYTDLPRFFLIKLTPATGGAHVDYYGGFHTILIEDDDPAPVLTFGDVPSSVVEGDADWTLNVPWSLTGNFRGSIKFRFGRPYVPSQAPEYVLTPGDTARTVQVTIDANDHSNQTQTMQLRVLSDYEDSRIQTISHQISVVDDDAPALQIGDATTSEYTSRVTLPIQMNGIPADNVKVNWTTTNGTAVAGEDFIAASGTVEYGQYVSTKPIEVTIKNDSIAEGTETFYIDITSVTGPVQPLTRTRYIVTVGDNDNPKPVVTLSAPAIVEGTGGEWKAAPVRVQLAAPWPSTDGFTLLSGGGTASAGADYTPFSTTLWFEPGETEKIVTVSINPDTAVESDEHIVILAKSTQWGDLATTTLVIENDDTTTSLSVADTAVLEETGSSVTAEFRLSFSKPAPEAGTVRYTTADNSAMAGSDYTAAGDTLSFAAGQTELLIPVEVLGDGTSEGDEKFALQLSHATGGIVLARDRAFAIIYDDDEAAPRPTISIGDIGVTESDGSKTAVFELRLSSASTETVEVSYETSDGTATAPSDYEQRSGVVTFAPGLTSQTISIAIAGDDSDEETETFSILLSDPEGAITPDVHAVCTITDDDQKRSKRRTSRH